MLIVPTPSKVVVEALQNLALSNCTSSYTLSLQFFAVTFGGNWVSFVGVTRAMTHRTHCTTHTKAMGSHYFKKTRPSSDSEAATMYKLKGKSSNMWTGQGFKWKELVRQLVCSAGLCCWSVKLVCSASLTSLRCNLHVKSYMMHLTCCILHIAS